jgi:diguanylate cyclase (GGDEF)-like protein
MKGTTTGRPVFVKRFARPVAQRVIDAERSSADADQGAADADQTASDTDQAASERDETDAASDQLAAERDQAIADERRPLDTDRDALEAYEASKAAREETTIRRLFTHVTRSGTAHQRGETAEERDAVAALRDVTSKRRDLRSEVIDRSVAASDEPLADKLERVRARASVDRARAAADRDRASQDREDAAHERSRLEAELNGAHLDYLTGAFCRDMGLRALTHEIERARRADGRFVLAFVDIDGMRRLNDRDGHAAGDHALRALVSTIRSNLRPFDPVVRFGGDEFVCRLGGIELEDVRRRFDEIDRSIQDDIGVGISVGLAVLAGHETIDELIARADAELLDARKSRSG